MIPTTDFFSIANTKQFDKIALQAFRYQYVNNLVYKQFCDFLKVKPHLVKNVCQIPFLPIQFFKTHCVVSNNLPIQETFTSSGTTGIATSKHYVTNIELYKQSYRSGFSHFYGNVEDYVILALVPSYLERDGSSLIYMIQDLILQSKQEESGFYLHNYVALIESLIKLDNQGKNVILIGVTYALLDLIEMQNFQLKNTIIMETGGMKGRRKEMIREELHTILCNGFGVNAIHSEYGMTELLSQAYSIGNGIFECPNWMRVEIRDTEDALSYVTENQSGGINIIDLANYNSCSFIATQDLGKKITNNSFEVLGRFDHSDIRGCNLLVL